MIEPTGYTALDLIGFTDRGAYDPTANYVKNDIVTVGNTKWRCKIDDTTGVTPAENANWTIYLESATSLAGMDDVTLTSPKNGDGLVHDGNDWKNIPITTKEQWKKNGAYNLLENIIPTEFDRGVTFTVSDGVTTLSGTASSNIYKKVKVFVGGFPASLRTGEVYKLVGCPTNTSNVRLIIQENNSDIAYDSGNGATFTQQAFDNTKSSFVYIEIPSGKNVDGIVIKPMITTDLNATYNDYVPHAKTNRELTFNVVQDNSVEKTFAYNSQICICSLVIKSLSLTSTGTWVTAYSLPSNVPKPRWETSFAAVTFPYASSKSNAVIGRITTDGDLQLWIDGVTATPVTQVAMNFMYPIW